MISYSGYDQSLRSGSQPTMCTIHTEDRSSRHQERILSYLPASNQASTSYNSLLPANGLLNFNQRINIFRSKTLIIISASSTQPHRHTQRCAFTVQVVLGLIKMTMRRSHHKSPPHTDKGNNVLDSLVNYNKALCPFNADKRVGFLREIWVGWPVGSWHIISYFALVDGFFLTLILLS